MRLISDHDSSAPGIIRSPGHSPDQILQIAVDLNYAFQAYWNICSTGSKQRSNAKLYGSFENRFETQVATKLLELAIAFRRFYDELGDDDRWKEVLEKNKDRPPGFQYTPTNIPLPTRETCNKIIHARTMRFESETFESIVSGSRKSVRASSDLIILTGRKFDNDWECGIKGILFTEVVYETVHDWAYIPF